jgi:hypothetical protein
VTGLRQVTGVRARALFPALAYSPEDRTFLLTPEVRARFTLERVPAEVRAEAGVFVVREVAP